ncbi:MAG: hypothetical protein JWN79_83 [Gemmatimonadetes bacterium]|jgi:hypothetical protein|nr:hypothetical protein [Gemmatimonadota bacterium]
MPKSDASLDLSSYATVANRITLFYDRYPGGRINTDLVSRADGEVVFRASVYRDDQESQPAATGWASERIGDGEINRVACLENTETSAVGRALANLGFTASSRRPCREEMEKADRIRHRLTVARRAGLTSAELHDRANAAHDLLGLIGLAQERGMSTARTDIMRTRVATAPGLPLPRVRRLELRLRGWLRLQPL